MREYGWTYWYGAVAFTEPWFISGSVSIKLGLVQSQSFTRWHETGCVNLSIGCVFTVCMFVRSTYLSCSIVREYLLFLTVKLFHALSTWGKGKVEGGSEYLF